MEWYTHCGFAVIKSAYTPLRALTGRTGASESLGFASINEQIPASEVSHVRSFITMWRTERILVVLLAESCLLARKNVLSSCHCSPPRSAVYWPQKTLPVQQEAFWLVQS